MKGIILKDLYENFCIPKNAAAYIFAALVTIPVGFLIRSQYYYIIPRNRRRPPTLTNL